MIVEDQEMTQHSTTSFCEDDSDFYDPEYYLNLEWRYLSGAIRSRNQNILASIGPVEGKKCLDVGCGGGFFVNELAKRGANASGVDYAAAGVRFANKRYPHLDVRQVSAYELAKEYGSESFDLVTLLDVIEHMSDHERLIDNIHQVLKKGGRLVVSTDVDDGIWETRPWNRLLPALGRFSADSRAARLIFKVERQRPKDRNYNDSHINHISVENLQALLERKGFRVVSHRIYPMVGAPLRDYFLGMLPPAWRGDHQCVCAEKV
jgi:SAM-dependent methyltransferase